ncbi:hypothetical protein NUH86_14875 [Sphingobium sp. JS3065]|uniref:HTH domain-containing protein n=1 Tax=Sphingobium sp. JS3065 TaxID=2970925 RepID=UPI0022655DD4|nr:hypothetical protein [Sphingobium sp. JS3065]UZW54752.1 hypothetical protein NUH86_14875 [Sphingobium sp. JS3065]
MDEALAVLKGDAEKLPQTIWVKLKGYFSDRPASFDTENASHFISDDRVVELVKGATRKTFANEDISEECQSARVLYASLFDDAELYEGTAPFGERLLEDAVAFTFATLVAYLTPGDRILLETLTSQISDAKTELVQNISAGFADLSSKIAEISQKGFASDSLDIRSQVDEVAIDNAILEETKRFKRRRFIQDDKLIDDGRSFAGRLRKGLSFGTPTIRAEAFRELAIIFARDELIDEASAALESATSICDIDVTAERARLLMLQKDFDSALKLLRGRVDPASISMFIQAICLRDGSEKAIAYYTEHHSANELTGHALLWLSMRMSELAQHTEAKDLLHSATPDQIDENPLILFEHGRLCMALAMAPDVAARFLKTHGLIPRPDDYRNDQTGQQLLSEAISNFQELLRLCIDLNADDLLAILDQQILGLRLSLRDAPERQSAEADLRARLSDPNRAVDIAPLALLYNIDFDWSDLKAQLAHAESFGGLDTRQLRTAFAFVMRSNDPAKVAEFVGRHEVGLTAFMKTEEVIGIRIEALAKSDRVNEALELLEQSQSSVEPDFYDFLKATIDEHQGANSISARLTLFEQSDKTHDLEILISSLSAKKDSRLGHFLALLWQRKHQLGDAAKACDAFLWNGQTEELDEFLDTLADYIPQHHHLGIHQAWKFQRQGELSKALAVLDRLNAEGADNHNIRQLRVSILLELGRWSELEPFLQSELSARENRSSRTLMSAAQLATALESPSALPLVRAALDKEDHSPQLFLAAYHAALNMGAEGNAEVSGWLKAAIDGSEEDGPVWTKDIDDAVELMRESQERGEKLSAMIMAAELPLSLAAKPLNVTLSSIYLGQSWENRQNTDPRKHNLIPAYAGNRLFWKLPDDPVISFDVTSLLTLQSIGILDKTLSAISQVVLPAGTMSQIFQDYSEARHTQPSRVQQAQEIKRLIAAQTLTIEKCDHAGEELEGEVGAEFARLYQTAMRTDGYVIDTAPLHPPGKLKETIDPSRFADRLVSPKGLIAKLNETGDLSDAVANEALAAIFGSGEEWPSEPSLAPGKPLYLSMTASHYLADAEILPRLKSAFGQLVILPDVEELANREIANSTRAAAVRDQIEQLRASVAAAIENGTIRIGKLTSEDTTQSEDEDTRREIGPLFNALQDISGATLFVCDDRALNKNGTFTDRAETSVNTAISLDVLRHLEAKGAITNAEFQRAIEKLYEGGFALVPVDFQELVKAACASNWNVGPNAKLRQIRNSIHLPLIRGLIKLPEERHWFRSSVLSIAIAIRHVWSEIGEVDHAMRAATYLYDMIPDVRAWSAKDNSTDRDVWVQEVTRSSVYMFGSAFMLPESHVEKYQNWFDNYVGPREERRDPGVMEAVAKALFESLSKPVDLSEVEADG